MISRAEHVERVERLKVLAGEVGQVAYGVHEYFGNGLLEKVYEVALEHRLVKVGYTVERQKPLKVFDHDGYCVGEYFADMIVNDELIVELKAVKSLAPEHLAQTLNYMKITGSPVALLINFGSYKFERRTVTLST
ncbi:MAG: GxxExxY protein [Kiritimatiellae bacterium]|nr:GxxExxY protein [Kiritimatiellia bacterium]